MPLIVDFLLPTLPVSHQAKDAAHKRRWRDYVYGRAMQAWPSGPLVDCPLKFTMVYLAESPKAGDINNFVKPVQDALSTLIFADDSMVLDVSAHLRRADGSTLIEGLPSLLALAVLTSSPCVYVAISDSGLLAEEFK